MATLLGQSRSVGVFRCHFGVKKPDDLELKRKTPISLKPALLLKLSELPK
jgi:hypothetical protein